MSLHLVTTHVRGFNDWMATSIAGLNEWIAMQDALGETIYRGQKTNWKLLPSICRHNNTLGICEQERQMFEEFKARAPRALHLTPQNDWEWLVLAQHHGLPTRLLDWTKNVWIAIWFALQNTSDTDQPEIWAFRPENEDVVTPAADKRPFAGTRTKVFKTDYQIARVRAQSGQFVLFKATDEPSQVFVPLEKNHKLHKRLVRLRLGRGIIELLQSELASRNINECSLKPELDDIAKKIKARFLD